METFILFDAETKQSKGSGFVKMRSRAEAASAIESLNRSAKPLEVRFAVSKLQRQRAIPLPQRKALRAPPQVLMKNSSSAGPTGSNIFVFHIPPEWTEFHLRRLFSNYGFLVSATIVRDKLTNVSKGFGFVSYDNPYSAHSAVAHMNGFMVGSKRLKVQLKRGDEPPSLSHALLAGG